MKGDRDGVEIRRSWSDGSGYIEGGIVSLALGDVLLELLGACGVQTDDALWELYLAAGYPDVSAQRLRTARVRLVRRGLVRPAGVGVSERGNAATAWEVVW